MYFQNDGFLRDPERPGNRLNPQAQITGLYTGGWNAPYTYADLNNVMLAAMNADGKVLAISGHRDYTGFGSLDPANPNWKDTTNKSLKYMVLRPRPVDHATDAKGNFLFPFPEDAGGDVKNLTGFPGGNDSIWIDMGFPVKTTPDGRKYKMLAAPLILDMDGRVNLNAHGNVRGAVDQNGLPTHASNQGYGRTEINLSKVLNAASGEWTNLFKGNPGPGVLGHFGTFPGPNGNPPGFYARNPPFYSSVDTDGCNELSNPQYVPTMALQLPVFPAQMGGPNAFSCWPGYPPGYGNGSPNLAVDDPNSEMKLHPLEFDPLYPGPGYRTSVWSEMEAIVRHSGTNSPALTSDLQRLCPLNFAQKRVRNQVTTHSFHLDRPAVSPWVWNPTDPTTNYAYNTTLNYPIGNPIPFPQLSQRNGTPQGSDFDPATWRTSLTRLLGTALKRVDLNRKLTSYLQFPNPGRINLSGGGCCCGGPSPVVQMTNIIQERQQFAQDIFNAFLTVTGAPDLTTIASTDPQFQAARWLAQLAVNIVDYIDEDDYITPFGWFTDSKGITSYVYGTELPRLVINESYVELQDPTPTTGNNYSVNFWLELLNPFQQDTTNSLSEGGSARLNMPIGDPATTNPYPVYQVYITTPANSATMRKPDNTAGDPDPTTVLSLVSDYSAATNSQQLKDLITTSTNTDEANLIRPLGSAFSGPNGLNQGFFVLGPTGQSFQGAADPAKDPTVPVPSQTIPSVPAGPTSQRQGLVVDSLVATTTDLPLNQMPNYNILLRRLACPELPPNPDPTNTASPFNPYVTVDYVETVQVNDAVTMRTAKSVSITAVEMRSSVGRNQPYAAHTSQQVKQAPMLNGKPLTGQPQTTFFRHNSSEPQSPLKPDSTDATLKLPFDWLVHLDRQLLSPMELLHVSGFKPHELTQQFMQPGQAFAHRAPWYDQQSRLYRFFELFETRDRSGDNFFLGRVPGKINLNSIWDVETFRALCDAQTSNYFTEAGDVDRIFKDLIQSRSPTGSVGANDVPFLPMSTGITPSGDSQYPAGIGINNTFLRLGPAATNAQPLFDPVAQTNLPQYGNPATNHPFVQKALLSKIYNHLTTRSNVFAVWLTVGFFEVKDDTTLPVRLGAEIGRSENRHIRHRMFALVDRTSLTSFTTQVTPDNGGILFPNTPIPLNTVMKQSDTDPRTGRAWNILNFQPGTILNIDQGVTDGGNPPIPLEENVVVMPGMTASFIHPHSPGAKIQCFGNPGPWIRYDPRLDTAVVPYFSVID